MDWLLWLVWTVWMTGSLLSMTNAVLYGKFQGNQDRRWLDPSIEIEPQRVCWIIAMKGFDSACSQPFVESLLRQTYSNYRLVFAFESGDDEGYQWIREHFKLQGEEMTWRRDGDSGPESITLVIAGPAQDRGQKVHNQLAAMEQLTEQDQIVAFADADIICPSHTLAGLVTPIHLGHFEVMTTFRWLVPKDSHLASLFGSVINASCATMGGHVFLNTIWGGMMAMKRSTFEALEVREAFSRVLSDDLKLNSLVRLSGRKIGFVRSLIVPSPITFNWGDLFRFGQRQYFMVKFYSIKLYLSAYEVTGFYLGGLISTILAIFMFGYQLAWIPLGIVMLSDQVRAYFRRRIYRRQFREDPDILTALDKTRWIEHFATPVWMAIQFVFLFSVLFKTKITWAGIRYQVTLGGDTKVISRND
ncbi:MAG: glycosyltransferase [Verrucomicrobiota bacterium]